MTDERERVIDQESTLAAIDTLLATLKQCEYQINKLRSEISTDFDPDNVMAFEDRILFKSRLKHVNKTIKIRRVKSDLFGKEFFIEPAWEMLLHIYTAHCRSQKSTLSDVCRSSSCSPTAALRYISLMIQHKVVWRENDPNDARRLYINLSEEAIAKIEHVIDAEREM